MKSSRPVSELGKSRPLFFVLLVILLLICVSFTQGLTQEKTIEAQTAVVENLNPSENVTLDFKEADIRNVLKIISLKAGINIITTPDVTGNVTIRLTNVPWQKALEAIVKTHGFGFEKMGNIITVAPIEKLTSLKRQELDLAQVQPTTTEVIYLKYIDAQDAKKALDSQLSARGKITVLEMTGQAGWEFGGTSADVTKRRRVSEEKSGRSRILIVSDIPPVLEKIKDVINDLDIMPQQVLIEARIMEVDKNVLRDLGVEWATGQSGAENRAMSYTPTSKKAGRDTSQIGVHQTESLVAPSGFTPLSSAVEAVQPYNLGLELVYKKLTGTQFEVMVHALEENVRTNTLSSPRIIALSNQEASILIGTKYPILKTEISGTETAVTNITLDYYQDIGIQLNVVPQVGANNYINMVVHPAVTSYTEVLGTNKYPIIQIREAETRVLIKDGETVVIGGLLKDVKTKNISGVPFLKDIPFIGPLFRRDTNDIEKIDLLIFITARIIKESDSSALEIAKAEKRLDYDPIKEDAVEKAFKKAAARKKNKK